MKKHGAPEDALGVEERPEPPVGPGQVRVRVRAAGINFADVMARVGLYPDAPKPPTVMGYEVAGEVEAVGEGANGFAPGQRVAAATRFNGFAELATANASDVFALPERMSFEEGAAVPVNYGTAYAGVVLMAAVRPGERVLVHAAAGGVGTALLQLLKDRGAHVIGTASAAKHDAVRAQGCTRRDRLPHAGREGGGRTHHRWGGGRRGVRRARRVPYRLPPAAPGRPHGHVRRCPTSSPATSATS